MGRPEEAVAPGFVKHGQRSDDAHLATIQESAQGQIGPVG